MRLLMNLRLERFERCLSQKEIADIIDVSQSTWSRAERGLPIDATSAGKIAKYFDEKVKDVWDFNEAAAA
jgi:DNA-binding XRE family transcriptional regulator